MSARILRLTETTTELATQTTRITETEERIEELENSNMEAQEALLQSIKQQRILQDMLTDQEGRSQRNNIRIFGLKEGRVGSSMTQFTTAMSWRLIQDAPWPTPIEKNWIWTQ